MVKPAQSHFKDKVTTFFLCAMLPKSHETFMFLFSRIKKIMIENNRPHDATRKLDCTVKFSNKCLRSFTIYEYEKTIIQGSLQSTCRAYM